MEEEKGKRADPRSRKKRRETGLRIRIYMCELSDRYFCPSLHHLKAVVNVPRYRPQTSSVPSGKLPFFTVSFIFTHFASKTCENATCSFLFAVSYLSFQFTQFATYKPQVTAAIGPCNCTLTVPVRPHSTESLLVKHARKSLPTDSPQCQREDVEKGERQNPRTLRFRSKRCPSKQRLKCTARAPLGQTKWTSSP